MLSYEYETMIKVIKNLQVQDVKVYFAASPIVEGSTLTGKVHRVGQFFNKRFFKLSPEGLKDHSELEHTESEEGLKSLFITEGGSTVPSKTELKLAEKAAFDLYTITNFSFMDLALHHGLTPTLFALTKSNLNHKLDLDVFEKCHFTFKRSLPLPVPIVTPVETSEPITYDAIIDLNVRYFFSYSTIALKIMYVRNSSKDQRDIWIS